MLRGRPPGRDRYHACPLDDEALPARLKQLATEFPYGYLLMHGQLKAEDFAINRKRTYRIHTEEGPSGTH